MTVRSVIDYGADPTGVRDSTDAINQAVRDAAACFPSGTYRTSSPIQADGSTVVVGDRADDDTEDWTCGFCDRGQCARCSDPDCTCCNGNPEELQAPGRLLGGGAGGRPGQCFRCRPKGRHRNPGCRAPSRREKRV